MSVVGLDIGNLNCYIGIARQGGIEVITNDYSLHATPTCVSFGAKNRSMGVAARQSVNTNFKNTIINFKHLIGRKFSDSVTKKFLDYIPCQAVALPNDEIGLKVQYCEQEAIFTPEQVLAALLTKLRETIESQSKDVTRVTDCVVSVPYYFTDVQRRATQAAIQYAGLNALRVINESTAIALAYGIYKQDLPEESAKARYVVFLDIGHASSQASVVAFNKGKLQMLGTAHDMDIGGLWFDVLIRNYFREDFKKRFGVDAKESPRAWLRLLDESEKVKKQMSANQTPIPINIECFLHDKDVSGKMQRAEFEELAMPLFDKLRKMIENVLHDSGVPASDVDEIEIVGGSSRIPFVRRIVNEIFQKDAKTTMNQDEAVARGAAMQCAILSPTFRVREFAIKDSQPYQIKIMWSGGAADSGESDVFKERDEFPFSKMVTLHRKDGFQIDARYAYPNTIPHTTAAIGSWRISGVLPEANGDARKVKVKVRVNPNGVFTICQASMYETQVVEDEPATEQTPMEQDSNSQPEPPKEAEGPAKPKTKTTSIDLKVEEMLPVTYDVAKYTDFEKRMQETDRLEKVKADAKNAVEEYVYEMRDKLSEQLQPFITPLDSEEFQRQLSATEDWLYDEGEDADTATYQKRLQSLKGIGEPVVERYRESESRRPAFDAFDQAILRAKRAYDDYVAGSATHAHLESKDWDKILNSMDEHKKWLDESRHKQEIRPKTETPVVFTHEVTQKHQTFENVVLPILNRKKPAPPKEEKKAPETAAPNASADVPPPQPAEMEVD